MTPPPAVYGGSKSPYPEPPASASAVLAPPGCTLVHVTLLTRHGTRAPTEGGLRRISDLQDFLSENVPNLPGLESWAEVLIGYQANSGNLTARGLREMRTQGARFYKRYHTLLTGARGGAPVATTSSDPRCVSSAKSFLDGYATAAGTRAVLPALLESDQDAILRYAFNNGIYKQFSKKHMAETARRLAEGEIPTANVIAKRIAEQIGAPGLRPEHVRTLGEAAAFAAAHGYWDESPFSRLLAPGDAAFFATLDAESRPILNIPSEFRGLCAPLLRDFITRLEQARAGLAPVGDLKFAHSETITPLLTLLGIVGNGLDPTHKDFRDGISAMSPFASNFCMELFMDSKRAKAFVRFRLHERYVAALPALGEHGRTGVVPLDKLLDFFEAIIGDGTEHAPQQKSA